MTTTNQARDLFARSLELDKGEAREAFLDEECGDNADLRLEVEWLLAKSEKVDSFFGDGMETTVLAERLEPLDLEGEGDRVGPYVLRQRIGEGGFGIVWMAEQIEPISRMVALKVVKAGMDTRQVLARFEAERQALAMMDHPNIAKVLDAGATASGRPYFAMELVKGIPITEFCNDQDYGPRRRLELFRDVCSAVNHAHQKGIIHRDLKPSNVMITLVADEPVVKVIDFGIAKATHTKLTEKTLFTRFEQFLGTPVYMSPEQAAMSGLDIDTRSDIYSLGVLLYELLAGAPPFDQKSLLSGGYDEMRRIIREDEPPRPSTRLTYTMAARPPDSKQKLPVNATALRGELDWIVMKAIEKDRSRRYDSANALAADLDRFLTGQPVEAAAPSAIYRFRKLALRHKAALGTSAVIAVLLLAGIATTSWQAVRATKEKNRAQAAEALAEQRLEESEQAWAQSNKDREAAVAAQQEAELALSEAMAVSEFLTVLLSKPRPGEEGGGKDVKLADVLDNAVERLDRSTLIPPHRVDKLRYTIARTYYEIGTYEKAIELRKKMLVYRRQARGEGDPATVRTIVNLARAYRGAGLIEESDRCLDDAVALSREHFDPKKRTAVLTKNNLALAIQEAGRRDASLEMQEEVLEWSRAVFDDDHPQIPRALSNLAVSLMGAGRLDEALELRKEAFAMHQKSLGKEHPTTLDAMGRLATSYHRLGKVEQAADIREEMLPVSLKVHGQDHSFTLLTMRNLAVACEAAGRRERELQIRAQLVAGMKKTLGPDHPDTLLAMSTLASRYEEAGRRDEAKVLREEEKRLSDGSSERR